MSAIRLKNVSFSYSGKGVDTKVLNDVSLDIKKGDSVAIIGPSGSGKSTLLNIIGCFHKAQDGDVWIDGEHTASLSDFARALMRNRKIGFVFQHFHLLPKASVLENILLPTKYPCEIAKTGKNQVEKARALAADLGLAEKLENKPNELSGGQQQRVAIARALINDAEIILADEPTGNLDSENTHHVIELLKELHRAGKTIVVITHNPEVAQSFDHVYEMRDGKLIGAESEIAPKPIEPLRKNRDLFPWLRMPHLLMALVPLVGANLSRHRMRSFLTMLGVCIGIAAVLSTITLGRFAREHILSSFSAMGVHTLGFTGHPNPFLKTTEKPPFYFQQFAIESDLRPLMRVFPQIEKASVQTAPSWGVTPSFGGKSALKEIRVTGVGFDFLSIANWPIAQGKSFSQFNIKQHSSVCVIGSKLAQDLFVGQSPLGQMMQLGEQNKSYSCTVIGVLSDRAQLNGHFENDDVFVPYTYFQSVSSSFWGGMIHTLMLKAKDGTDMHAFSRGVTAFFEKKYGRSAWFFSHTNEDMLKQMNQLIMTFGLILATLAFVTLLVGGIGITNMMMVSLTERLQEIGLRKALGSTDLSVRMQFLLESFALCLKAGIVGAIIGFFAYHGAIYAIAQVVPQIKFAWTIDLFAIAISFLSIVAVGILSGMVPALRAERFPIAEALRAQ